MTTDQRRRLIEILRSESVMTGDFTLASGKRTNLYLDCRRTTLHPEGSLLVAELLLDWLDDSGLSVDCVGGPTLGADPIVGAMVALSAQRGRPLPGFLVRKEAKGHGTGQSLEGQYREGWKALVVEDTTTTAGSLLKAIGQVERAGLEVVATCCVVDREEGARETLAAYRFEPLFTLADLRT